MLQTEHYGRVFLPERSEAKGYVCEQRRMKMMRMRNWGFSFTVIDGRRKDGRVSLRIREEMKDLSFKELKNFDRRMGDVGMT